MSGLIVAGALLPFSAIAFGSVAFAGTCSVGDVDLSVYVTTKDIGFTNELEIVTVPPHGSATWSISSIRSYTSSVTGEASATFKAGIILAQAETTVGFSLKEDNTTTTSITVSVTANNGTASYHDYVGYRGTKKATGTWKEYHCVGGKETLKYSGTWGSWNIQASGAVRCDDDAVLLAKYGSLSLQYAAARTCT